MANVELRKITPDNEDAVVWEMTLEDNQQDFVATNAESLAQAYVQLTNGGFVQPWAIYADGVPVGFIMYNYVIDDDEDAWPNNNYYIWRLLIDKEHQGKGYGKAAVALVVAEVRAKLPAEPADYIYMSYVPGNTATIKTFAANGFELTDIHYADPAETEKVMRLPI